MLNSEICYLHLGARISPERSVSRRAKILLPILLLVGLPVGTFVALEGGSSLVLFCRDLIAARRPRATSPVNTEYDAALGWVAKKAFAAPDMFAPGVALHTNVRGFRGESDVTDSLPAGRQRLVCSGDSFTLGHSVGDADTWCALLASPSLETVNMGQIGYGIDQAYLWYLRDGRSLSHTVHVLAFVTDDFERMAVDRFLGYSKPRLLVRGDSLVVSGVPTPRQNGARPGARFGRVIQSLRSAQLVTRLTGGRNVVAGGDRLSPTTTEEIRAVTARLVADLQRVNTAKQSRLVLVYLPIERDFVNDAARRWREQIRTVADSLGVPLIDLIPALRERAAEEVQSFYVQQSGPVFEGMGHFTVQGNRWAARQLVYALDSLGAISAGTAAARRR